jgi:hypothetical protein
MSFRVGQVQVIPAGAVKYQFTQITNSGNNHNPSINNNGQIVWEKWGSATRLMLYENNNVSQIATDNSGYFMWPRINNKGQIAYIAEGRAWLYTNGSSQQLGNSLSLNGSYYDSPDINDKGEVVWMSLINNICSLCYYNSQGVTNYLSLYGQFPSINNNSHIISTSGYYYHDGNYEKITNSTYSNVGINDLDQIVWQTGQYPSSDIYLYSKGNIRKLNNNNEYNVNPRINNAGNVVWTCWDGITSKIYLYANGMINYICEGFEPDINDNNQIVYAWGNSSNSIPYNIYFATPNIEQVEVAPQVYALCIGTHKIDYNIITHPEANNDLAAGWMADNFAKFIKPQSNIKYMHGDIATGGVKKSDIKQYFADIKAKLKDGDALFIYIAGHGGISNNGYYFIEIGNDMSSPSSEGVLTDTDLFDCLKGMDNITKWVMIDACHSGGFWNELSQLKKVGLLSASGPLTWSFAPTGIGLFTYGLANAFSLDSDGKFKGDCCPRDGKLLLEEVYYYAKYYWILTEEFKNFEGKAMNEMEFGDQVIFSAGMWNPGASKTDDLSGIKPSVSGKISCIFNLLLGD